MDKSEYNAEAIRVLEGLEGVRQRPAMYIGGTGKEGLHHLVYEVVDNSVDEALSGCCKKIKVSLNKDGSVTCEDDGRGIPVDINQTYKIPAVQLALTKLHAGGKFDKKSYLISGGLHGVGISVVNALSKKLIIEIKRNRHIYRQEYSKGLVKTKLKIVESCDENDTGTKVIFWPDETIFSEVDFDYKVLETRFREIAFLNSGLKITLIDEEKNKKKEFFSSGGLIEFVRWLNDSKEILHKPIYFKRSVDGTLIEVAIQYNSGYRENIFGFVNTINTVEGGTHIYGFKTALTRVINDYMKKNENNKISVSGEDVREGLTAIVNIKIPNPQFEGQTKTKLGNSEIKGFVDSIVTSALSEFFEENPSIVKKILSKASDSAKARLAAKKAKELVRRKTSFSLTGLPGKLADCSSKKTDRTELYLVEGESAAGSSKAGRDRETQAILALKGKIINVEKSSQTKVLSNEEVTNIITAVGTGIGEQFDINKLRYSKVIIMTDADVDGEHIKTLLLTFFYRFMPELVKQGKVYAAVPPLYRIRKNKDIYVYSDKELKKVLERLNVKDGRITRFKGLGEMSSKQLWETTMNPKSRKINRIYVEDAVEADRTFIMLMGNDIPARKAFIQENAKEAKLDI
jgi:DNA gyrase subunit B